MYAPFSLSTRSTTTTSLRLTRMSFWIDRIRLLESSESKIIPSMLSYSSYLWIKQSYEQVHLFYTPIQWDSRRIREEATYKFDIGTHFRNMSDLDHDQFIDFWVVLLIVSHCAL